MTNSKVIPLFPGRESSEPDNKVISPKPEDQLRREERERREQERLESLDQELAGLSPESVTKDETFMKRNRRIEKTSGPEGAKLTITDIVNPLETTKGVGRTEINEVIFEELGSYLANHGAELSPDQERAIYNYLFLAGIGDLRKSRANETTLGAMVHGPWNQAIAERTRQISERKIKLLKSVIDPEVIGKISRLQEFLQTNWYGEEWEAQRAEAENQVHSARVLGGLELLEAARHVQSMELDDNPVKLQDLRQIDEAIQTLSQPGAGLFYKRGPGEGKYHYYNAAIAAESAKNDDIARQKAARVVAWLREEIKKFLVRDDISLVTPKES